MSDKDNFKRNTFGICKAENKYIFSIDDELSVENCEQWFPLIHLHAAIPHQIESGTLDDANYFCMSAVKNSISEYKQNTSSFGDGSVTSYDKPVEVWNKQPTNNAFLQSVCLSGFNSYI